MTKEELIVTLKQVADGTYMRVQWPGEKARAIGDDQEEQHMIADDLLLAYINDDEIESVYADVPKWYA